MHEGCKYGDASRWCIVRGDLPVVACRCGFTVIGWHAWRKHDNAAVLQAVDPDRVQRQFCEATGIRPRFVPEIRRKHVWLNGGLEGCDGADTG